MAGTPGSSRTGLPSGWTESGGVVNTGTGDLVVGGNLTATANSDLRGNVALGGAVIAGVLDHNGTTVGLYGTAPATQPAAIANASGGVVIDAEARTALNSLLAAARTLGLIAT